MCSRLIIFLTFSTFIHLSFQLCDFSCHITDDNINDCVKEKKIKKVNSTVLDDVNGIVDFQFEFLCNYDEYEINVKYSNCSRNNCNKSTSFGHHSEYHFVYSNDTNSSKFYKCSEMGRVLLQNIQTGCYRIKIKDKYKKFLYDDFIYWQTSYIKQEVDISRTHTTYNTRNDATELKFNIKNPILSTHPNISLQFKCKNSDNFKKQTYNLIQDARDKTKLILDQNGNSTELNISCDLRRNIDGVGVAECYIFPIRAGTYDIKITFFGEPYKCPQINLGHNVQDILDIVVAAPIAVPVSQPLNYIKWETTIGSIFGAIIFLISILIVIIIIKLSNRKINDDKPNTNENKKNDNSSCSNLLLLYARNSEAIMTMLSSLRKIFVYENFQVYDIYDPARLNEINENNNKWILNLINRDDVKIL